MTTETVEVVKEKDPVCGMMVLPSKAAGSTEVAGHRYYFCGKGCLAKFEADPQKYLAPAPVAAPTAQEQAAEYICPMDPEVSQRGPGSCPKCGMALEPAVVTAATRTEYTCPMHPEVVAEEPGNCPKCGMALEARDVAVDEKNPRTGRHDAQALDCRRADRASVGGNGRWNAAVHAVATAARVGACLV